MASARKLTQPIKLTGKFFFDFSFVIPLVLGVTSFLLIAGPRVLIPTNIGWLGSGDPAQHFLGWQFFTDSSWSFPIGLNPNYGLELGSAIIFSDSNPLFAFFFKPFSTILPNPFQYFGLWLLLCFVLQSWFGWKLIGLISNKISIRLLASSFFIFAPPMMWRLYGHLSLVAHFVILGALYLSFTPSLIKRQSAWLALLALTALIHAYLLAMVGILWLADLLGKMIKIELPPRRALLEFTVMAVIVGFVCWQVGYFSVGAGTSASGFGVYRMNLLSVLDANGWSYALNDIPNAGADAGSNFFGLGFIFLIIFSLPKIFNCSKQFFSGIHSSPILAVILFILTIFALSNKIGFGSSVFEYPLPDSVLKTFNIFRASERMFWPVFYAIYFFIFFVIIRGYDNRVAVFLLSLALLVQIIDTSAAWRGIRNSFMTKPSAKWNTQLTSPFWSIAATKYSKLRWIQPESHIANWLPLSYFAGTHGLATDAVYLARVGSAALREAQQTARNNIETGNYESDSLYILDDRSLRLAALTLNSSSDMLTKIDGFNVLAPGWKQCVACPLVGSDITFSDMFPSVEPGRRLFMGKAGDGLAYLLGGWSVPEDWGTWSDGDSAEIVLPVGRNAQSITIEAFAFVSPTHPKQDISVLVDGIQTVSTSLDSYSGNIIDINLPKLIQQPATDTRVVRIKLRFQNAVRPTEAGLNEEVRKLAIGLKSITIE